MKKIKLSSAVLVSQNMGQVEYISQDVEAAINDFRHKLPDASTCCDDLISEEIIVGAIKMQLNAVRIQHVHGYMWTIQSQNIPE